MSKSLSNRGFTLVEVLCSLGIFSIIFICMMSYGVTSLNIKKSIKTMNDNVLIMETLRTHIIYSMTYEELQGLQMDNRTIINYQNITFDKVQSSVKDLFTDRTTAEYPYIELSFIKCEFQVYSLGLSLYGGEEDNIPELQCYFYKGNYR